ncbi:MAG: ComEC/Rec2 family competence protein [Verrucomicrobiota bacterium]|nr:ComEC/Rec2 family competence protein [Verrucomicrobiota bacterium]
MSLWEPRPRLPCAGVACAAIVGILLADRWEVAPSAPLLAMAGAAALAVVQRRTLVCALFVAVSFFALHTVQHYGNAARRLAQETGPGSRLANVTGIVWSEPELPRSPSRFPVVRFRLKVETLEMPGRVLRGPLPLSVSWTGPAPAYGDRVEITGTLARLAGTRNPGQFDFTGYMQRQGVYSELKARYAGDCRVASHGHGNPLQRAAMVARHWIQRQLERDLADSPQVSALITSMVLGLRGETPEEVKELFQRTGTLHLFAVSGLNIAMLGALVWFLLKPLGIGRKTAVLVIIPVLAGYALVTGLSPSCVRAAIMGSLILVGFLLERPGAVFNSLAAAAAGILAWDTEQLFTPGFQFSFVLVVAIVVLAPPIQQRCERLGAPDPFLPRRLWNARQRLQAGATHLVAGILGVTLAAWIGSLALTVGYFHLFSVSAIVANLIAVPLAFAMLGLGLLAALSATVTSSLAILFNNANWFCARLLLGLVEALAAMPGGHVYVEVPRLRSAPPCELIVFDLGEGGAAHVRMPGQDWLVDCGHASTYDRIVLPYLRSRGINRLDGLVLTHGDAQHVGAATALLDDFRPRRLVDSPLKDRSSTRRALHRELAARGSGKSICQRGDRIPLSGAARLEVLYPPAGLIRSVADDKALVLRLKTAGQRVLFVSDSGFYTEQWLLENEPDLRADLLVKGRHAKDFSGTLEFLRAIQPRAVITAGLAFGEPSETLDAWTAQVAAEGIRVFRHDQCGAVSVTLDADGFVASGFIGHEIFRSRAQ